MKKLITFLAMLVACVGLAIGASACSSHEHDYNIEKSDENYHWTECACGETTEKVAHPFVGNTCSVCGYKKPTKGLEYILSDDKTYYSVTGIGTATDTDIVIPITYKGLPVTTIRGGAFEKRGLTNVVIPDSVTEIGWAAFCNCPSLTSVTIGNGVTTIGKEAFSSCYSLTSITVDTDNETYTSIDGNLYNKEGTTLIQYAIGKPAKEFTIPDSVTTIGEEAFWFCESLTSIEIPDSVTTIVEYAFYHCSSLTSIVIPDSVTTIGREAFSDCDSLTSIVIPDGVTEIGLSAFSNCDSLQKIYCEAESQPSGWDSSWKKNGSATVVWGYKGE